VNAVLGWRPRIGTGWVLAFAAVFVAIAILRLAALDSAPPGLHKDEAAFGYNAWTIAHFGVDQDGRPWPLFFTSFGDYKSPVYVYLLAPLTWVLPLTSAVERLPAAVAGIALCVLVAFLAFSITRSLVVALLSTLTAAIQPWIVIESRSGWAPILEILGLTAVCLCLSRAKGARKVWWFVGAGIAIAFSLYAYDTGRLFAGMVAVLVLIAYLTDHPRQYASLAILPPTIVAYLVLLWWSIQNPGALTARFNNISVVFDHPPALEAIRRALQNYTEYVGVPFLFTHGDPHLLHGTGFAGVLLVTTAPIIFVGLIVALLSRRQPLARFALLALATAPIPAALTVDNSPDAPRANAMMAFFLLFVVFGWSAVWPWLARHRLVAAAFLVAIAIESGGYLADMYTQWPSRSQVAWDAGQADAVTEAYSLASGHTVWLSNSLDDPYIFAYFKLLPDPGPIQRANGPIAIGVKQTDPNSIGTLAKPGDIMVFGTNDTSPQTAVLIDQKGVSVTRELVEYTKPMTQTIVLATIWRR
jgi:4-amino-4-deoxy-L-arabinose transferase-like glycosyltransferase